MGGSDKAYDEKTIGTYNSGLKFSMALALRAGIDINIRVLDSVYTDNFDRDRNTLYSVSKYTEYCEQTGKEKELIQINKDVNLQSFFSVHCEDLGGGDLETEEIKTGFSTKLGIDWENWMILREIYSNMIDEGGYYLEGDFPTNVKFGTIVSLKFDEDSEFADIWNNRHLYINEKEPLCVLDDKVEVLENPENYLRIYKQNILVYSDEKVVSKFAWNIKFSEIDEKRLLRNVYSVEQDISSSIMRTTNEEFLRQIITKDFTTTSNEFLNSNCCSWQSPSDLIHDICYEIYSEHGEVKSYDWIISKIKDRKDCKIGGKKIKTVEDSIWSYSKIVTLESTPLPFSEPAVMVDDVEYKTAFEIEVNKYYNFKLDVEVKIAKLKGSKCVADKFEKCIIIDESFDIQKDFHTFVVEYLDLTQEGNVVTNLSKYIVELIKK